MSVKQTYYLTLPFVIFYSLDTSYPGTKRSSHNSEAAVVLQIVQIVRLDHLNRVIVLVLACRYLVELLICYCQLIMLGINYYYLCCLSGIGQWAWFSLFSCNFVVPNRLVDNTKLDCL